MYGYRFGNYEGGGVVAGCFCYWYEVFLGELEFYFIDVVFFYKFLVLVYRKVKNLFRYIYYFYVLG